MHSKAWKVKTQSSRSLKTDQLENFFPGVRSSESVCSANRWWEKFQLVMSVWVTLIGCRCLGVSFVLMPVWLECCGRPGRSAFAFSVADYQLYWPLLPPVNFLMPSHFESCRTLAAAVGLDRLLELPETLWRIEADFLDCLHHTASLIIFVRKSHQIIQIVTVD